MNIEVYLLIVCGLVIVKDIILFLLLQFNFKKGRKGDAPSEVPFVSILLAARNEEQTIERCIKSLVDQHYPTDRYEILVGNDRSEDTTLQKLQSLKSHIDNLKIFDISKLILEHWGKMNVLAQIGEDAKGDIFLLTDADTRLPRSWISTVVNQFKSGYGILTGVTMLESSTQFGQFQRMEWIHAIGMMKVVSDLNVKVSSIGNNMAISREAYKAVGGYAGIPFSITEDYEIYRQVCKKGYKSFHMFEEPILAWSLPMGSFWQLIMQRKRWMFGAFRLPMAMLSLLILNGLYYIAIFWLLFLNFQLGIGVAAVKILFQSLFIGKGFSILRQSSGLLNWIWYEIYSAVVNLWSISFFIIPIKVKWKGRKF
ncbi:MAG: glycosyltransferase [Bacteroidetes bacterium]|nr:glycosyltransferase [Bacteroidota bacterium]